MATQSWVELALSLPIVLWAGWLFFERAVQSVLHRRPNMWTLIGLGTSADFISSVVASVAPGVFSASFVAMGRVSVYFEAAAVTISLTLLGQILELKARSQTSTATGIGARSHVSGRVVAPGDTALMDQLGVSVARLRGQAEALRKEGTSVIYMSVDDAPARLLAVTDRIKASTPEASRELREAGPHIVMATGDGLTTDRAVAAKLGIGEVYGGVKPADKLALVERLRKQGLNDAPALAKADVGITMSTGTDVVMNSAQGQYAVRATIANMKQKLGFAFVYDALGVPLAAGLLYPFTGWLLSPMIAALAMSLRSASDVTNPLRLRKTT